jgi:serine/threonine protein kinase
MNAPNALSSSRTKDVLLARFVRDLTSKGPAVLDDYVRRYPGLEQTFREMAALQGLLEACGAGAAGTPVPRRVGDYHVLNPIAQGGMGVVYAAIQEPFQRQVALKVVSVRQASRRALERFRRERDLLSRLFHPHVIPIYGAGRTKHLEYFAMPLIEGATLQETVRAAWLQVTWGVEAKMPPLTELVALALDGKTRTDWPTPGKIRLGCAYYLSVARVLADVADALHYAHQMGTLHRDVKPSNVMLERNGHCWVIDFGLARQRDCEGPQEVESAEAAAGRGPAGTQGYIAPEQFRGQADVRTDVWGLGATLYHLLTLRRPRPEVGAEEVVDDLPTELAAICRTALSQAPADRYQSTREFGEDLRRWLDRRPTRAGKVGLARRAWLWARRNKGWLVAIINGLLAAVFLVLTALWQASHAPPPSFLLDRSVGHSGAKPPGKFVAGSAERSGRHNSPGSEGRHMDKEL